MALKWWPQANWTRTIAELFSELRGELTSLQPMDSKDIRWNKTANGMEALLVEPPLREQAPAEEAEAGGVQGSIGIGRLKSLPGVGSGRGTYVSLTVNTEGELVETGAAKPVIIPRIYHIN